MARVFGLNDAGVRPGAFLPGTFRPIAPSGSRVMGHRYDRDRGSIETNFARLAPLELHGFAAERLDDEPDALTARTLLGSFSMSRRLGLIDLKVVAFAIERWRESGGETASDAVTFTLYKLGQAIYGHAPSGEERRLLKESIRRLFKVEINAYGADARRVDRPVRMIARDGRVFTQQETLWDDAPTRRQVAARRGDSYRVWLGPWLVDQLRAGNVTYLHFPTMRGLAGLALRLWVFLQAEPFVVDDDGATECIAAAPELGDELYATLGMNFARPTDARKALRYAARRIQAVDHRYAEIRPVPPPPKDEREDDDAWRLYAVRAARPVEAVPAPAVQEVLAM